MVFLWRRYGFIMHKLQKQNWRLYRLRFLYFALGSLLLTWINFNRSMDTHRLCRIKILLQSQTSKINLLKCGNGQVISSHTLWWVQSILGSHLNHINKRGVELYRRDECLASFCFILQIFIKAFSHDDCYVGMLVMFLLIITPDKEVVGGYIGFSPSVRLSVRPACRVRSITSTVLDGFFPY